MTPINERRERILDVAIDLAEKGGFDNVRQREVAALAGVALGTLYKSFRSKEDILVAALDREAAILEKKLVRTPPRGETRIERATDFFGAATRTLLKKPNFARAVLRAMASGEPEIAGNVAAYYGRLSGMVIAALRGTRSLDTDPTEAETTLAYLLLQVWFASLVGWSAGIADPKDVVAQVAHAGELIGKGLGD